MLEVRHVAGHVLRLRFSDGPAGEIDLAEELWGPVFEPLRDVEAFKEVRVNHELHTISWPNGADFAPEFLHSRLRVPA